MLSPVFFLNKPRGRAPPPRFEENAVFKGPGHDLFVVDIFPRDEGILPPFESHSIIRALPFDGAVLVLIESSPPSPEAFKVYAGAVPVGAAQPVLRFELEAVLGPEEFEFLHPGLTAGVEYSYIVTRVDSGTERALSARIAYAVPGDYERGYMDEKNSRKRGGG